MTRSPTSVSVVVTYEHRPARYAESLALSIADDFVKAGYRLVSQRGDSRRYEKDGKCITVNLKANYGEDSQL